jgi:hypothetical protein
MKYSVLITHASEDDTLASLVRRALEEGGMSCRQTSELGNSPEKIATTIEASDAIVLILSSASSESAQINREVEQASNAGKLLIPFRIDTKPFSKHLEFYLSTAHWIEASTPPFDQYIVRLVSTARHLLGIDRQRPDKKAIAAMVCGILSIPVLGGVLGPAGIILGIVELKATATGRSFAVGRKYAWIGIISGSIGMVGWLALMFRWWYWGINPGQELVDWLTSAR